MNIPEKIYIQIGEDVKIKDIKDWNELSGVTWCSERIHKNDIVYVRKKRRKKLNSK
jgi:hypothetical protein